MGNLACVIVALIWGSNIALVKDALTDFSPMSFNGLRLPLAALLLLAITAWAQGGSYRPRGDWFRLLSLGLLGNTLYQLLFIYGVEYTTASNTALLLSTGSIFIALLSWGSGHERLGLGAWLGILLSVAGVGLVIWQEGRPELGRSTLTGDALILCATFSWALYTVLGRSLMRRYTALAFTSWTFSLGALPFLLLALPWMAAQNWETVALSSYLELAYSVVFALAVAYALWFYGVKQLGSTRTSIYGNLVPFVGVLTAWLFLGEPITALQVVGGILIVGGAVVARTAVTQLDLKGA